MPLVAAAGEQFIPTTGRNLRLIQEILTYAHAQGKGPGPESNVGTMNWSRGMLSGFFVMEATCRAMRKFGNQPFSCLNTILTKTQTSVSISCLLRAEVPPRLPPSLISRICAFQFPAS